jgi:hypothetical protein
MLLKDNPWKIYAGRNGHQAGDSRLMSDDNWNQRPPITAT